MIQGRRVEVPLFDIQSSPTVRLSDVKKRRFRLMDAVCPVCGERVQDLLGHAGSLVDPEHAVLGVHES